jgi:predicted nucleic acid-binding protein
VYGVNRESLLHEQSKELLETGLRQGISFVIAHQNMVEFIAVLTRGYGIGRKQVMEDANAFASRFEVIFPLPTTLDTFFELMEKNKTTYPFDLYLAATMLDNQVTRIITENAKDFQGLGLEEVMRI